MQSRLSWLQGNNHLEKRREVGVMNTVLSPIINIIAEAYDIPPERVTMRDKRGLYTVPRYLCYWATCRLTDASKATVGALFDKRDPAAISYGVKYIRKRCEMRPELNEKYERLLKLCEENLKENPLPDLNQFRPHKSQRVSRPPASKTQIRAMRKCLMCHKDFSSSHVGNRICGRCRETQPYQDRNISFG